MEDSIFSIRKANKTDIYEISEVTREAFNLYKFKVGIDGAIPALAETIDDIRIDIEKKEVFVATLNGKVVGSVRVEIMPDNTAYLSRFGVSLDYQNNGVGKTLLNAVDNKMAELGITTLYLHTASKATELIRFYYGRGFYIISTSNDKGYIRALLCKDYMESLKACI